ncbi:5' exonuclease Apollo isoform X2 [Parambassis ranga]|uniref:5' exonuclease Apollo n=1 Tax=Parambassis ranga TaxID=210632 RepID=A0A6P7IQW3_9TELE|nr:5' exonuclease Apollo isoform X2 [Parambassis ranga]
MLILCSQAILTGAKAVCTVGLTSTWSNRPIYCSPVTATLLRLKLRVKEQWIHPLELGEPYLLPLDDIGKERLTVTLIDANHCPGSVMFLFEGYFGSILYTGDFRYTPSMLREPCLRNNTTIDVLYLDDTNCDPNRTLPSRQRATQQIKEIIRSHPTHNVVIGLYALGKESLLLELAMEFKTWIEVSFERMETLKALELPDVFTTEPGAGRIRVVKQSEICSASLHQWNKEQPTLAIFPTSRHLISFHPSVHVVPYSDHSSYQELEDFVSALKPTSLVPLVGNCLPGSLSALLPSKKRHEILVPESVQHYMLKYSEKQLSSSAFSNVCCRHFQPLVPKGVVFESPVRSSRRSCDEAWEEECLEQDVMDIDTESETDCIFMEPGKQISPDKSRRESGDTWNLDRVQTVSEEMAEPLNTLAQNNHALLTNTTACLKPARITKRPFEAGAKMTSKRGRHGSIQDNHTLPDVNGMSQHNVTGQNEDVALLQSSSNNGACASSIALNGLQPEFIEELENRLLNSLPFSEEDFKPRGLLQQSCAPYMTQQRTRWEKNNVK